MSRFNKPNQDRRTFVRNSLLLGGGVLATIAGCSTPEKAATPPPEPPKPVADTPLPEPAEPPLPDGLDPADFHIHNPRPLALESRRGLQVGGGITALRYFFVRNNLPMPPESILDDRDAWELEIEGVKRPGKVTLAQLKRLGIETTATVLQCSGNGRAFSKHGPSGSPWGTGAAGCAMWTGVRVSKVIEMLGGAEEGAKFLTAVGGEPLPEGVDPLKVRVARSIPLEKGLDDCLLVWEMNGVPLPITHGGPLRLVVPGYYGCNQIKYVKTLGCTTEQTPEKIQQTGYRLRPIGKKGKPDQPAMWRMNVKSWLTQSGAEGVKLLAGKQSFIGVAFSGERGVKSVEWSLDGKDWKPVRLTGPDLGPNAWRTFAVEVELPAGKHTLFTRATDSKGEQQPEGRIENERGYGNNSWRDLVLMVEVAATQAEVDKSLAEALQREEQAAAGGTVAPVKLSEAGKRGKKVFAEAQPACGACHTLGDAGTKGAVGPNLNTLAPDAARVESAVKNGVGAMPSFGESLSDAKIKDLAQYVLEATKAGGH